MRNKYRKSPLDAGHVVVLDIETIVPDLQPEETGFPKWSRHRPVVASLLTAMLDADGQWCFHLDSLEMVAGEEDAFFARLESKLPADGIVVTANGRGFDVPALALNAMAARCFELFKFGLLVRTNRYQLTHADVCDLFSNYSAAPRPSLAEICGVLDIPVKVDTHGSEVGALAAAGERDRIRRYCESDVAATYLAWLHWAALTESDDRVIAPALAGFARWIARDPALAHLMPIARCAPAQWARGRAVQLRLEAAQRKAARRAELSQAYGGQPIRSFGDFVNALPAPLGF